MICNCQDWKENIDKLNAGFVMLSIHGQGGYSGKQIKYCPWCGNILSEDKPKEKSDENN